ncbi:hypothetical protein B0W47_16820 (plasmid) [Komagataeibacter nataicola]|uniref:Uncharacterized protein n=1 Tax=Komagataeibacter nataicola TaxID=265960 RepID=A0A9N7CE09_9PROT|nr:hypothetical protein [Komagataeibacter nataicola]AQU89242.1 hypothetical protein B0W47_16820 [Komagataeibacter nataicola]PYD66300.1 hypothetical protein CDI09_09130 [Komagataeibacter nataicola]WNM10344.1 hypothetical protein RI056_18765 [Komagataeibacter nataicola]GBR23559.1 hypothetical protein AA0616_2553 [Komagataeibacter nataicola NRIC 0616]
MNKSNGRIQATMVPDDKRIQFERDFFNIRGNDLIEHMIFVKKLMQLVSPSYHTLHWKYMELNNGGLFMYPDLISDDTIVANINPGSSSTPLTTVDYGIESSLMFFIKCVRFQELHIKTLRGGERKFIKADMDYSKRMHKLIMYYVEQLDTCFDILDVYNADLKTYTDSLMEYHMAA